MLSCLTHTFYLLYLIDFFGAHAEVTSSEAVAARQWPRSRSRVATLATAIVEDPM